MSTPFDGLSDKARARLREREQPDWAQPTLATLVHAPFDDANWLFEPKLDGERCLVFKRGTDVRLLSRNRTPLGRTYPEIVRAVREQVPHDCVLDGEIVAFDGRKTSFARLQQRMQHDSTGNESVPVHYYLFDVLHLDGYELTALALRERKKALSALVTAGDPLHLVPYENTRGTDYYQRACAAGQEGALAKDATSAYANGRSRTWLKFKCVANQELVIGGYTEPTGSRPALGALLVGYYDHGQLVYAGKVGTGFDDRMLRQLHGQLSELAREESPFAGKVPERGPHWVAPRLVAEIAFTEWTQDGRLRHPSFVGLRSDKEATEVTRERAR